MMTMYHTPRHKAACLNEEERIIEGKKYLEEIIKAAQDAEANPLHCGGKTAEEIRRIQAINIYNACNKVMEKMTDAGKAAMLDARDWACLDGYQSLMFVEPVPEKAVMEAAQEIWKAYKATYL